MLKHLYIKNFTLIDELDIEFSSGFSVITGETGAGKSIILGAIGLLLGQRADLKTIKQGAEKCIIEAHFDLSRYKMKPFFEQNDIEFDATDTIIRRELTASGKSRAFVNDSPVALTLLKELGERLVDVHSQHQNLLINKHDFQLQVVDIIAQDTAALDGYAKAYSDYQELQHQLQTLIDEIEQNARNKDFLKFQFEELTAARLVADEQEDLEARADTMTHAEDIKQAFFKAENHLLDEESGVVARLKRTTTVLHGIEGVYPKAQELAERLQSSYIELKDIADEVSTCLENIDFDPAEMDAINARLDRIYDLEKKYRVQTVEELLAIQNDLERRISQMENSADAVDELKQQVEKAHQLCITLADELTSKRKAASKLIEQQMLKRLVPLGMPKVRFQIELSKSGLQRTGQDKVAFLFSANSSTPLQPVAQVASGGEIARVMLALKAMISGAVKLPTIIFDEIDTGVSGKIAEQMAQMMQEMGAQDRQVISITHLPQIAAKGSTHYKVYKNETPQGTTSHMLQLGPDERINEIAQMLSGSDVTDAAIQNAKELLKL